MSTETSKFEHLFGCRLDNVDQEVAARQAVILLRQEKQRVQAEEVFVKVEAKILRELEMIKECLAIVDPMLSSGMLVIARKTWGDNGLSSLSRFGTDLTDSKQFVADTLKRPIGMNDLNDLEEFNSGMRKSYAKFKYQTSQINVRDYYTCEIDFWGGKPKSIGTQTIDYAGSDAVDLRKYPDFLAEEGISRVLECLYRKGPWHSFIIGGE